MDKKMVVNLCLAVHYSGENSGESLSALDTTTTSLWWILPCNKTSPRLT